MTDEIDLGDFVTARYHALTGEVILTTTTGEIGIACEDFLRMVQEAADGGDAETSPTSAAARRTLIGGEANHARRD